MTAVPLLPKNAPFSVEEISVLNKVVSRTTPLQRSWLAGFFAGFEAAQGAEAALQQDQREDNQGDQQFDQRVGFGAIRRREHGRNRALRHSVKLLCIVTTPTIHHATLTTGFYRSFL